MKTKKKKAAAKMLQTFKRQGAIIVKWHYALRKQRQHFTIIKPCVNLPRKGERQIDGQINTAIKNGFALLPERRVTKEKFSKPFQRLNSVIKKRLGRVT